MAKVLGKGLEALIKMHNTEENDRYLSGQILIEKIVPNKEQPRQSFDDEQMNDPEGKEPVRDLLTYGGPSVRMDLW